MAGLIIPSYAPPAGEKAWPHVSKWRDHHWVRWMSQSRCGYSDKDIQAYLRYRKEQAFWIERGKQKQVLYAATPWGLKVHQCTAPFLLTGGAVGCAKSHTMRWDFHMRCLSHPRYRALIFRRTFKQLEDNHLNDAANEAPLFGARFLKEEKKVVYPNGSWLRFAHCERVGDEVDYLSSEYEIVGLDELATFEKVQAMGIFSRLRTSVEGIQSLVRCSTNPGGANTLWCLAYFVYKTVPEEENPYYDPKDWQFIKGYLWDNPYLMDPDGTYTRYLKKLGGLSTERRRQLLEGDFSAIEGQFFAEFRGSGPHAHVQDWDARINWDTVVWERSVDWGYNNTGCCQFWAILPDGRLYMRGEYTFRQTIVSEVAQQIERHTRDLAARLGVPALRVRKTVCDPSMDNDQSHVGESMLDTFRRFGIRPAVKGDNDRVMGWQRLRHWLGSAPDGEPWMILHPDCRYSIRTWPSLVSDPHNPEDVDTAGDDHGADSARYLVMSRPAPLAAGLVQPPPSGSLAWFRSRDKRKRSKASFYA